MILSVEKSASSVEIEARLDPEFADQLSAFERSELDSSRVPIFGVWSDLRLAYLNEGWFRFGLANGAGPAFFERWSIGSSSVEALPEILLSLYRGLFEESERTRDPVQMDYNCSSPDLLRIYRMQVYPLERGYLVGNVPIVEMPHPDDDSRAPLSCYRTDDGYLVMCVHCQCTRRRDKPEIWDWVPAHLELPQEQVSHGLCELCLGHHYPKDAA